MTNLVDRSDNPTECTIDVDIQEESCLEVDGVDARSVIDRIARETWAEWRKKHPRRWIRDRRGSLRVLR